MQVALWNLASVLALVASPVKWLSSWHTHPVMNTLWLEINIQCHFCIWKVCINTTDFFLGCVGVCFLFFSVQFFSGKTTSTKWADQLTACHCHILRSRVNSRCVKAFLHDVCCGFSRLYGLAVYFCRGFQCNSKVMELNIGNSTVGG